MYSIRATANSLDLDNYSVLSFVPCWLQKHQQVFPPLAIYKGFCHCS